MPHCCRSQKKKKEAKKAPTVCHSKNIDSGPPPWSFNEKGALEHYFKNIF